ncbi:MAG: tryptophan--tRNA ligase [Candidatus Aenigmarchaeota archaeon]|nr:tryptophan--tRNA ligase [Candidatus Aenigmarchaeota archaeon]
MEEFKVTPWNVEGEVDYEKLIKQFGVKKLDVSLLKRFEKIVGELHVFLRRGVFFAHRDFDKIIDDLENGKRIYLYTGRGPSGPMHIGHILPFYFTKWLQDKLDVNVYIQITDDEKFLVKKKLSIGDMDKYSMDNILDIAAVGFDPDKTFIFRDTEYIKNMYRLAIRLARKITLSTFKAVFGFENSSNVGIVFYPVLQMIPCFFEKNRVLIPAAIDQDPYWRIQRDLAESFGYLKSTQIHAKFLPSLLGPAGKMSASKPESAIFLSDDPETVKKKIFKYAFSGGQPTVELHRKLGGNPDIDVSFQWLYMFFEPDDKKIKKIEEGYRSGKLLTGELKQVLIDKLSEFLEEHQKRRKKIENKINKFMYDGKLASEMWSKTF